MMRTKWTIRVGLLGAVVSGTVLATPDRTAAAQGAVVTGIHANEEFCKTLIRQVDLGAEYMKQQQPLSPDVTKRAKYFADQKALNAKLVKTAPASLTSDVVRFTTDANAMNDAQLSGAPAGIKTAIAALTSPEHLAAARRANDYCGAKVTTSR